MPLTDYPWCDFIQMGYFVHVVARTHSFYDDVVVKLPIIVNAKEEVQWTPFFTCPAIINSLFIFVYRAMRIRHQRSRSARMTRMRMKLSWRKMTRSHRTMTTPRKKMLTLSQMNSWRNSKRSRTNRTTLTLQKMQR